MRTAIRAAAIGSVYSAPQYIAVLAVAVAASALPLLMVRPWGRTAQ